MNIVIIGLGVVGTNMRAIFPHAHGHDPAKHHYATGDVYDIGFVCVPTDMTEDGSADLSVVYDVLKEWRSRCRVLCLKSTVPPGTTEALGCVFSPEYFGATQHANNNDYDFVILGGPREQCHIIAEAYKEVSTARLRIMYTDSRTAELVKLRENAWLATKVTFCNEWARIAAAYGRDDDEVRELWLLDPRVNRSHTFVYREHPYYDSHCLNKDVPAIIRAAAENAGYDAGLLQAVVDANARFKAEKLEDI